MRSLSRQDSCQSPKHVLHEGAISRKKAQKMYLVIHQQEIQEFKERICNNEIKKITVRDVDIA